MHDTDQCENSAIIHRVVNLDKKIDKSIIEHANICESFMFWLSYLLALNDSYYKRTNWVHGKECPERHVFLAVLRAAVEALRNSRGCVDKSDARRVRYMALNEIGVPEYTQHIESCVFCGDYYEALHLNMIAAQEDYERRIRNRENVRPVIGDDVRDIVLSSPLNLLPLESMKPN